MNLIHCLQGNDVTNLKDYQICKSFLNLWLNDNYFSLDRTCYYLDNYKNLEMIMGHGYAPPSFCFKFVLNNSKMKSSLNTRDYCYHGTSVTLVNKIVNEGLLLPNGSDVKARNGSYKGKSIYTTKIPEHAQIFADPYQWEGKYFQILFLVRQDLSKVDWAGHIDRGGRYANQIYKWGTRPMQRIHLLHLNFLDQKEVQWGTVDQKSVAIEAVIVKMHDEHPIEGEYKKISKMISELQQQRKMIYDKQKEMRGYTK